MRRRFAILLVTLGLVAACGGAATPTPSPSGAATPAPTDLFVDTPSPSVLPNEATPTPEASPVAGKRYVVKRGDTMYVIALRNGITVAALKAANPKVNPNAMRIGTVLVIPSK